MYLKHGNLIILNDITFFELNSNIGFMFSLNSLAHSYSSDGQKNSSQIELKQTISKWF